MAQNNNQSRQIINKEQEEAPKIASFQSPQDIRKEQPLQGVKQSDPIMNANMQICQVCCIEKNQKQIKIFNQCGHRFCQACLNRHIQHQIKTFKLIKCLGEDCNYTLEAGSQHIKSLPNSLQYKYYKIMVFQNISKDGTVRLCPTEQCDGFITITKKEALCAICKATFCAVCLNKYHEGDCDKNGVVYVQDNYKFRQCRNCKMVLERTQGCDHMTCRCGHQFCYLCGKKWDEDHRCPIKMNAKRFFQCLLIFTIILMVIPLDLIVAIFLLVCLPIGATILIIFMAMAGGAKIMVKQRTCPQIVLGNIFLLLAYAALTFCDYIKLFFTNDIRKCWRRKVLLPLSHIIWNAMADCFGLYQNQ